MCVLSAGGGRHGRRHPTRGHLRSTCRRRAAPRHPHGFVELGRSSCGRVAPRSGERAQTDPAPCDVLDLCVVEAARFDPVSETWGPSTQLSAAGRERRGSGCARRSERQGVGCLASHLEGDHRGEDLRWQGVGPDAGQVVGAGRRQPRSAVDGRTRWLVHGGVVQPAERGQRHHRLAVRGRKMVGRHHSGQGTERCGRERRGRRHRWCHGHLACPTRPERAARHSRQSVHDVVERAGHRLCRHLHRGRQGTGGRRSIRERPRCLAAVERREHNHQVQPLRRRHACVESADGAVGPGQQRGRPAGRVRHSLATSRCCGGGPTRRASRPSRPLDSSRATAPGIRCRPCRAVLDSHSRISSLSTRAAR